MPRSSQPCVSPQFAPRRSDRSSRTGIRRAILRAGRAGLLLTCVLSLAAGADERKPPQPPGRRPAPAPLVRRPAQFVAAPIVVPPRPGGSAGAVVTPATVDKRLAARLQRAKEYLDQGKFAEALPVVQQALDDPADAFVPDGDDASRFVSLKGRLAGWLSALPDAGTRSYELQYAETARLALREDAVRWADVAARYPIVEGGLDAGWRLAALRLDQGRVAEAARLLERLRAIPAARRRYEPELTVRLAATAFRSGDVRRANALLDEAARDAAAAGVPARRILLGDRPYDHQPESRAWLARRFAPRPNDAMTGSEPGWCGLGGGPDRKSLASSFDNGKPDVVAAWPKDGAPVAVDPLKTPTDASDSTFDKLLRSTVELLTERRDKDRRNWWPRFQPVIVGDLAIVRTVGNVRGLRLDGGARAWETLADDHLERLLARDEQPAGASPSFGKFVEQRMWDDATASRLSSDGRLIFAVEDSGPAHPIDDPRARRQQSPANWNRLAAYEASTGRLDWELIGAGGESDASEPGTFFLGAPLVVGDRLYALSERAGAVRMLELDAADGRVLWTQPLAELDSAWDVARNPARRLAGLTPSLADGLLVCPTGVGLVVAVDLALRRLAWTHELPQPSADPDGMGATPAPVETSKDTGWVDGTPVLTDGLALLPRAGGHPLYAVSLKDGARAWALYSRKLPANARWLAIDAAGRMLAVGERGVQSFDLSGREPTARWTKPAAIPTPCGTGFILDGTLHLPARETKIGQVRGLIARVDVETGEVLESVAVLEGRAPGNLALSAGLIVSQSVERIDLFPLPPLAGRAAPK